MKNYFKIITIFIILALATAFPVYAADLDVGEEEILSEANDVQSLVPDPSPSDSPDELFAGYVEQVMNEEIASSGTGETNADTSQSITKQRLMYRAPLTGFDKFLYNELVSLITEVARGERQSTIFEIDVTPHGYDIFDPYDASLIIDRLLAEHPYELYWYDKTASTQFGSYGGKIIFMLPVSAYYSLNGETDTFSINTSYGQSVTYSVNRAGSIVSSAAGLSDIDKLYFYKQSICDLTEYNNDAGYDTPYGDPWQMIWVFDDDPATNVVCEGYAKAFKFLCDLTKFNGHIKCSLITGYMGVWYSEDYPDEGLGGHMWNILAMDDDKNYLADITNCDSGSIGENDLLFLKGCTGIDADSRYYFNLGSEYVIYRYDDDAISLYDDSELTLSMADYSVMSPEDKAAAKDICNVNGHKYGEWRTEKEATCTETGTRTRICTVCQDAVTEEIPAAGHSLSNWTVIKSPTISENGIESRGCSECDYTEEREIEKLKEEIKEEPIDEPTEIWTVTEVTPDVKLSSVSYVYNGKVRKPTVTVKAGSKTLKSGRDYNVKFASGRKNVGRYSVKVTLIGSYKGSKTVYFNIVPKATSIKTLTGIRKGIKIKWQKMSSKMSKSRITGYQIQTATNSGFTKNKKSYKVSGYSKTSGKITGLKAKKTYYVRIRTYKSISGRTYWSKWSKAKKVKTK